MVNNMLEEINRLPRKFIKNLDLELRFCSAKVYLVQDFDLSLLENMVSFGLNIFGKLGMDEWGLVPQIRHGSVYILKEDEEDEIMGLAILMRDWENPEKAYLFDFAIDADLQGHGFGRQFLKIIAETLQEKDFKKISLTVDVENEPAIKLYRHMGFKPMEYNRNEYGKGHNRYVMEWDITENISC